MAWKLQIRALGAAMAFVFAGPAEAALTEQQVNEALGSVPGVSWSVEGPDAEAWTSTGTSLVFSSPVQTGTFALKATVTGPGVLDLTTSHMNSVFMAKVLVDNEERPILPFWGTNRITVGPGSHTVTWRGVRENWISTTSNATFRNAKWEAYAQLPLQVGAKDESVALSGGWVGQDRWHHGDGGALFSAMWAAANKSTLQADFTGPGILTYQVLARSGTVALFIDAETVRSLDNNNRWTRRWHGVGSGDHVAKWEAFGTVVDAVVDEMQVVQEVDLTTALDVPGRVWTSTVATGESRAIGLPTDGAVGGNAVVLNRSASFSTEFTGGGVFRIRQRGSTGVFRLNGGNLSHSSVAEPGSDWVSRIMVIPATGGTLSIAGNSETEFDAAEWSPTPASFAELFGLPAETVSTGGEGVWVAVPVAGKFEAKASLTAAVPTAWVEMNLTGPAKVTFDYDRDYGGDLDFLLDGESLWSSRAPSGNRVTLAVPPGAHVVRVAANVTTASESSPFEPIIHGITVVADPQAGEISQALGYPARWAYVGEWEKVAAPTHDGDSALRPVVPQGSTNEFSAWLGTTVTGPGYLTFWTSAPVNYPAATLTVRYWGEVPTVEVEEGWNKRELWFPQGTHQVQLKMEGSPLRMSDSYLDEMGFSPSAPASMEFVATGGSVTWEHDPVRPWTAVVKESGTPAVAVSPLRDDGSSSGGWETRLAAKVTGPGLLKFKWNEGGSGHQTVDLLVNGVLVPNLSPYGHSSVQLEMPTGESRVEWVVSPEQGSWLEVSEVDWQPWLESSLASALDTADGVTWESGGDTTFTGRPDAEAKGGTAAHVRLDPGQSSWIEGTMEGPGVFDFWLRRGATNGYEWQFYVNWVVTVDGTEVLRSGQQSWDPIWVRGEGQHNVRVTFTNPTSSTVSGSMDEVTWIPLVQRTLDASWASNVPEATNGYDFPDGGGFLLRTSYFTPSWIEKTVTGPCEVAWDSLAVGGAELIGGQPTVTVNGKGAVVIDRRVGRDRNMLIIPEGMHVIRWANVPNHGEGYGTIPPEELQGSYWQITDPVVAAGVSPIAEALDAADSCWLVQGTMGEMINGAAAMDGVDAYAVGLDRRFTYLNLSDAPQRLRGGIRFETDETWSEMRMVVEAGDAFLWGGPYGFALPEPYDMDRFTVEGLIVVPLNEALDLADEMPPQEGWRGIVSAAESADGVDCAWSFVNTLFQEHGTGITVNTAGRVRFRWKHQGASALVVQLNGAPLPLVASGEWTEISFEVGNGKNQITWLHESVEGSSQFTSGEAWLDAISFEELPAWDLMAAAAAGTGVVLSTDEPLNDLLQWKAVKATLPGGEVVSAARAATGSAMMRASITGPVVVNFRGTCFADKAAETMAGRNARGGKSVVVIGGGTWGDGGSGGEHAGYELTVMMGEKVVGRVPYRDGVEWSDVSFFVPEGAHEVTWQLNRLTTTIFPGAFNRESATWTDLQGWVSGIWLESSRARFDRWAEALPEGVRGPDDDADGDGVSNVLEYAFRSSSSDASSMPPQVTGRKGPVILPFVDPYSPVGGGYWVTGSEGPVWVPYVPSTASPTSSYELMVPYLSQFVDATVEMSDDMKTWLEHPVQWMEGKPPINILIPGIIGHTDTHQAISVPLYETDTTKFFRVKVAVPE